MDELGILEAAQAVVGGSEWCAACGGGGGAGRKHADRARATARRWHACAPVARPGARAPARGRPNFPGGARALRARVRRAYTQRAGGEAGRALCGTNPCVWWAGAGRAAGATAEQRGGGRSTRLRPAQQQQPWGSQTRT